MTIFATLMKAQVSAPIKLVKLKQNQFVLGKHFLLIYWSTQQKGINDNVNDYQLNHLGI